MLLNKGIFRYLDRNFVDPARNCLCSTTNSSTTFIAEPSEQNPPPPPPPPPPLDISPDRNVDYSPAGRRGRFPGSHETLVIDKENDQNP